MVKIDTELFESAEVADVLKYALRKHDSSRPAKLQDYYEGRHEILNRTLKDDTKPNNKLVTNLAKYIVDTATGYFMGEPVSYTSENEEYLNKLFDIFDLNHEADHNAELGKGQSVKGVAYELLYVDEESKVRFTKLPTENVIYIESSEVDSKCLAVIRIYTTEDLDGTETELYDVYTDAEIITFEKVRKGSEIILQER